MKRGTEIYNSSVGRFTYFAENVRVRNSHIGPFCSIGPHVIIGELAKHPTDMISTHPLMYSCSPVCGLVFRTVGAIDEFAAVTVGADIFIGARAMVFPGVNLGVGCIVGAGSIVTKDVPPYAIVVGVPGKIARYRFREDIASELLASKWWEWDIGRLERLQRAIGGEKIVSRTQLSAAIQACNA